MAQCGQKRTRGGESIFTVFLQTSFMDDPPERLLNVGHRIEQSPH